MSTTALGDTCEERSERREDEETARLVVLGEASLLVTALIKNQYAHQSYFYGRNLRHSASLTSRMAAISVADNDAEEGDDLLEETYNGDPGSGYPTTALSTDPILKSLIRLKSKLRKGTRCAFNVTTDPSFLVPFCEIIKNKETDGHITGAALQSVYKFVNYNLIEKTESKGSAVLIAESVTKARFVGTDTSTDEVVLMRIMNVLRELIVRGFKSLTNETICEIMQSSFRIAFEKRLSELLRKSAEQALVDMVRSLFLRVAEYEDMPSSTSNLCISSGVGVRVPSVFGKVKKERPHGHQTSIAEHMEINGSASSSPANESLPLIPQPPSSPSEESSAPADKVVQPESSKGPAVATMPVPVPNVSRKDLKNWEPHGIECVNELLIYMTSLVNPLSDGQNTDAMISVGLNLLIVTFESAVVEIGRKSCLMQVIRNDLCFNMIQLLQSNRPLTSFALTLRLSFIVFVYLRQGLKYQMQALLTRLKDIVTTQNAPLEYRELSLEYLVGFFKHIKFLPHEIFFNYDLDPYASNLMEELFEFFSKNCFTSTPSDPSSSNHVTPTTAFTPIQLLSLDALLANLNSLHRAEVSRDASLVAPFFPSDDTAVNEPVMERDIGIPDSRHMASDDGADGGQTLTGRGRRCDYASRKNFPKSQLELVNMKQRKCLLENATKEFNHKPKEGVQSLLKNSLVSSDREIAKFLRENQNLSKQMMGEFLAKKENTAILTAFIESFDLAGFRLDEALRVYLETFRLPGEAPLVAHLLEPFATAWHIANDSPFENHDAAFTLSYAIIMLNVDQHNINVKKQNPVMTCEQFINNVRGVNGGKDFDPVMLKEIYHAIKNKEIVMPAEHDGPVRDKYLWKCLLRRGDMETGMYAQSADASRGPEHWNRLQLPLHLLNGQIFSKAWGPTVSAMTFMYDRININHNSTLTQRILTNGFNSCALLCSSYGNLDKIIVMLCKFTVTSTSVTCPLPSHKTQLAAQTLFGITREYANEMRDSWINIVEIILYWFKLGFLDDELQVDDFALNKKVRIKRKVRKEISKGSEGGSGLLSSFYSLFAGSNPEIYEDVKLAAEKDAASDAASTHPSEDSGEGSSIKSDHIISTSCQPLSLIEDSKFLHIESLMELVKALINVNLELDDGEDGDDIEAFKLEILVQITLLNRDRISHFWPHVSSYIIRVLRSTAAAPSDLLSERAISAIFRLAIRFTPRPDETSEQILLLLKNVLITFEPSVIQKQCTAIALSSFITHCNSYIRKLDDWSLIFDFLLCVGIGCHPSDLPVRQSPAPHPHQDDRDSGPEPPVHQMVHPDPHAVKIQIEDIPESDDPSLGPNQVVEGIGPQATAPTACQPISFPTAIVAPGAAAAVVPVSPTPASTAETLPPKSLSVPMSSSPPQTQQSVQQPQSSSPRRVVASSVRPQSPVESQQEVIQPFIPGNSSVRDVEAYKKCVDVLTVIIKEILPKNSVIQSNPKIDAEINQMAIDSLITLRFYSLQDDRLREQTTARKE